MKRTSRLSFTLLLATLARNITETFTPSVHFLYQQTFANTRIRVNRNNFFPQTTTHLRKLQVLA
ncbi:MAG: hypothetical protein Fur0016_22730 [Anaerolineales bacterium]